MFRRFTLSILLLSLAGTGCTMFESIGRNLFHDPVHYPPNLGRYAIEHRARQLAEREWGRVVAETGGPYSGSYAEGFTEGFADYIVSGGSTEPPLAPPRWYWRKRYQTPGGQEAMRDWFAGFKHGAVTARASGYRQLILIPLPPPAEPPPPPPVPPVRGGVLPPPHQHPGPPGPPAIVLPAAPERIPFPQELAR